MWSAPPQHRTAKPPTITRTSFTASAGGVSCCAGMLSKFVLQVRVSGAEGDAGARWAGRPFCVTRAALLRLWQANTRDTGASP